MPPAPNAIEVRRLDKRFRNPTHKVNTLKERALHPFRRVRHEEHHVLRAIDFDVLKGEFFGIVGRNGSGKSTLLKCLAGIYRADSGTIAVAGRLSPFIELGVGFNPDLTARDNVVLNGVMMGLTPREARSRFDEIMAFAELEEFVDLKLKNYSSGMQVRLAFSVMVQADADVLLIDEVLAVGDAAFQQKCFDVFYRLREAGKTIILVTHEMGLVERFCHRALLISNGQIAEIGDPGAVGRRYLEENFSGKHAELAESGDAPAIRLVTLGTEDETGRPQALVPHPGTLRVRAVLEAHEAIHQPSIVIWIENEDRTRLFSFPASEAGGALRDIAAGEQIEVVATAGNPIGHGRHFIGCSVSAANGREMLLYLERIADFQVAGGESISGAVGLPHEIEVRRSPAVVAS